MKIGTVEEALELKRYMYERVSQAATVGLTEQDVRNIDLLIDAGEYDLALEALATQIHELDLELPNGERDALIALGVRLRVSVPFLLGDPWAEYEA